MEVILQKLNLMQLENLLKAMHPSEDSPVSVTPYEEIVEGIKKEEREKEEKLREEEAKKSMYALSQ